MYYAIINKEQKSFDTKELKYQNLIDAWKDDCAGWSVIHNTGHFYQLVGMGEDILPWIFEAILKEDYLDSDAYIPHVYSLLSYITGEEIITEKIEKVNTPIGEMILSGRSADECRNIAIEWYKKRK